ncbi:MAG: hypothetical protein WD355_09790 [Balneolaceae bacterium]
MAVLSALLIAFVSLQLPIGKTYIADSLTERFNNEFQGTLRIGEVSGMIPWDITLQESYLYAPGDSLSPVVSLPRSRISMSIWDLLQRQVSIRQFTLIEPEIRLIQDEEGGHPLIRVFESRANRDQQLEELPTRDLQQLQLLAPSLTIIGGRVTLDTDHFNNASFSLPRPLIFENLTTTLFLEINPLHRLLEIEEFRAELPNTVWEEVSLQGQIFNDQQFLEFNGFSMSTRESAIRFSAEATPLDLFSHDPAGQFSRAEYRLTLQDSGVHTDDLSLLFPGLSGYHLYLEPEIDITGSRDSLWVDRLFIQSGESAMQLTGQIRDIGSDDLAFDANLDHANLSNNELSALFSRFQTNEQLRHLSGSRLRGRISGNIQQIETELDIETPNGELQISGHSDLSEPFQYEAELLLSEVDFSPLYPEWVQRSLLNGTLMLSGRGFNPENLNLTVTAELDSGYINQLDFESSRLYSRADEGSVYHELRVDGSDSEVETSGTYNRNGSVHSLRFQGDFTNIHLNRLLGLETYPRTHLTFTVNTDIEGTNLDDLFGRGSIQVERSVIGSETLRPHQLYMDLNRPGNGERNFRLTSSFFDAEVTGEFYPSHLADLYHHWSDYLHEQVASEVLFDTTFVSNPLPDEQLTELRPANLTLQMEMKDIGLLHYYLPGQPRFNSRAQLQASLNADADRLLLTASAADESQLIRNIRAEGLQATMTAGFRHGQSFQEYGTVDLQLHSDVMTFREFELRDATLNGSMREDSLMVRYSASNRDDDAELDLTLLSSLYPDSVAVSIDDFRLGNEQYEWTASGKPMLTWFVNQSLRIDNLNFVNNNERLEISGIYSPDPSEHVQYRVRDLRLDRISDMIGGRVSFAGVMNGDFQTQSLTRIPGFQGDLTVNRFQLNDRLAGDVRINSVYAPDDERFDTRISILTDPDRYADYLEGNDNIGQNITLTGYLRTPDPSDPNRELYRFEADMREIDMWIVPVIVPGIIAEMEGSASGSGEISGSLNEFDFYSSFDIDNVNGTPVFTNVEYTLNGNLIFSKEDGLLFNDIQLHDAEGGSGLLSGNVDLDDFSPTNYMDLTLDMNNLLFMNNPYDPDIPFYARTRGTGQARITGSNFSPFLRTTEPIVLSQNSTISVPLLDDTDLEQAQNFIQFVDSFQLDGSWRDALGNGESPGSTSGFQEIPRDLTFVERFTLDLQFLADDQVNFQLIFDPVTNEILTANGTGQMRLTLDDQNFSLFGRMGIVSGEYQFVAGDIISRRFLLQDGGSIIWEGDPANARLNVNASYRARPDLSSLLATTTGTNIERGQRFPIDIILNIGGTISTPENDFYFNLPSGIEGTMDPTLTAQINNLNRNEEEKLLQATSILLTGNFIPPSSITAEGGSGEAFRESLPAGGAVVVNPLISSQVINPLLSDQINSILRSDMALDIDFNLTPYNQIDLGVALRLYDDRLILRREGQITGAQSDIGDLGATYRISRTFALTAFHRQDPTLVNTSGTDSRQTQEMNGIGLEAQVQFNSWKEFRHRVRDTLLRLLGIKERDEEVQEEQETQEGPDPLADST